MKSYLFLLSTLSILFATYESDCFEEKKIASEITSKYDCVKILDESEETSTIIFVVKSKVDSKDYVLKMVKTSEQSTREVEIMEKLNKANCPYVVKLYYHFNEGGFDFMVIDYGSKGTLLDIGKELIKTKQKIDLKTIYTYAEQITEGLMCMHKAGIYHVDIKLANIAIGDEGPLIFDFDFSLDTSVTPHLTKASGTPNYYSPLFLQNSSPYEYNASDDLFSLTVTLFALYYKYFPFRQTDDFNYADILSFGFYILASETESVFVKMVNYGLDYYKRRKELSEGKDIMNEFLSLAKEGVMKKTSEYLFTSKLEKYNFNTKILI